MFVGLKKPTSHWTTKPAVHPAMVVTERYIMGARCARGRCSDSEAGKCTSVSLSWDSNPVRRNPTHSSREWVALRGRDCETAQVCRVVAAWVRIRPVSQCPCGQSSSPITVLFTETVWFWKPSCTSPDRCTVLPSDALSALSSTEANTDASAEALELSESMVRSRTMLPLLRLREREDTGTPYREASCCARVGKSASSTLPSSVSSVVNSATVRTCSTSTV